MVTSTARTLRSAPAPNWAGVGTCTLAESDLARPHPAPRRLPYHLLALTTTGHGTVEVDFAVQRCRPGTLLWIRPGQAVRFGVEPGLDATLVAWDRDLLSAADVSGVPVDDLPGPSRWQLAGEDEDAVTPRSPSSGSTAPGTSPARRPARCCATSSRSCCCGSPCSPGATTGGPPRPAPRAGRSPGSAAISRTVTRTAAGWRTTPAGSAARSVR